MTDSEVKVMEHISNLAVDYKSHDERLTHEEALILDRLLGELKEIKRYVEPLRGFNTNNLYLEKMKEVVRQ